MCIFYMKGSKKCLILSGEACTFLSVGLSHVGVLIESMFVCVIVDLCFIPAAITLNTIYIPQCSLESVVAMGIVYICTLPCSSVKRQSVNTCPAFSVASRLCGQLGACSFLKSYYTRIYGSSDISTEMLTSL